jgi:hypothetical protein
MDRRKGEGGMRAGGDGLAISQERREGVWDGREKEESAACKDAVRNFVDRCTVPD